MGDKLTIAVPADLPLFIIFLLPLLILFGVYREMNTSRGRKKCVVYMLINIVILSMIFTPAKVELDARQGTATVRTVMFFVPRHHVIPLSSVQGAMVKTSELTEALALVLTDGHAMQLTPFDQVRGTDVAAAAINDFLRTHGGVGKPY
ncbi:MAG TPA: hypothetical protein VFA02_01695 [Pseudacidobacterium sp.]|nr:hypothetical protein [Pseudacidobacterium sp.]